MTDMTTDTQSRDRKQDIIGLLHREKSAHQMYGRLLLVLIALWIVSHLFLEEPDYRMKGYIEILIIFVAGFMLSTYVWRREKRREATRTRQQLIQQKNAITLEAEMPATWELGTNGQPYEGTLQELNLLNADLENAYLEDANLAGALLMYSNLQEANLTNANLQGALLLNAVLQGADLSGASLQGALLSNANLQGANLEHAQFDENTIVPDYTKYDPEQGPEQLSRFTDPEHPNFWRPEHGSVWWLTEKENNE